MRILIVSDTHKAHGNLERVLQMEGPIDMLIHLGDVEGRADYIEAIAGCPVHMVSGNNDFFSDLPWEEEFFIGDHHVFITHGHGYFVGINEDKLKAEARGRGADIVMYGHTHMPALTIEADLVTLNPGSISYPRQKGRKPSYIMMEMDPEGRAFYEIRYLV